MAHKNNIQNLRVPTSEQARINGRKGGLASAKAKKERKTMRELMNLLLSLPVPDEKRDALDKYGITDSDQTNKMMVAVGLMEKASSGDARAVEVLCGIAGDVFTVSEDDLEASATQNTLEQMKNFKIEIVDGTNPSLEEKEHGSS